MKYRIIDLTAEMYDGAPTMPMDPKMAVAAHCTLDTLGYNLARVTFSTHQGTHMDVPYHFFDDGYTLSELDLSRMVTPAFLVDLTHKQPGEAIEPEDLMPYEELIHAGMSPILNTGWYKVFPEARFFAEFPYVSCALADWLAEKKVNLIGMDMPTPNGKDWQYVHRRLLGSDCLIVEGLTNLDAIGERTFTLSALPLKIRKRDGSPVRAVAMLPKEE